MDLSIVCRSGFIRFQRRSAERAMKTKRPESPTKSSGEPSSPSDKLPPSLVEKTKWRLENSRLLAALVVLAAVVAGLVTFTENIRKLCAWAFPSRKAHLQASAGPGLILRYDPVQRQVMFTFPLAIRSARSSGEIVQSAEAILDVESLRQHIYFSGTELHCERLDTKIDFPMPLEDDKWSRLDCSLTKQLGPRSANFFLSHGLFRLTIKLDTQESGTSSADVCYSLSTNAVNELIKGSGPPKTFITAWCTPQ